MNLSDLKFDFLGKHNIALMISGILLVVLSAPLIMPGLRLGIDFTGGTLREVGSEKLVTLSIIRAISNEAGYGDALVHHFGSSREVLIRLPLRKGISSADLSNRVMELRNSGDNPQRRRAYDG